MLFFSFEESQNETHHPTKNSPNQNFLTPPPPPAPSIGEGYSAHIFCPLNAIWKTLPGKSSEISLCIFS